MTPIPSPSSSLLRSVSSKFLSAAAVVRIGTATVSGANLQIVRSFTGSATDGYTPASGLVEGAAGARYYRVLEP